ncbi:hypothetical protein LZ30DRAFT_767884 [Colletotrichum cereale]|nr:hypothetical protein LZ30DRAFT_767884 [Colletotrichum cereale]
MPPFINYGLFCQARDYLIAQHAKKIQPQSLEWRYGFRGGVHNTSDFWDMLINKKSGLTKIPKERWDSEGFYSEVPKWGTIQNRDCYMLTEVDLNKFYTSFFTCSQAEAERMDPMQRQLLEVTRECLDSAGETATSTMEKRQNDQSMDPHAAGVYRGSGYLDFSQANRISYEYNWTGPRSDRFVDLIETSMLIKTGCSSSMVALHLAAEAVQSGACTSAMALGCNLITSVFTSIVSTETGVLSPSGKCKTFGVLADGYRRGEAVNAVYVKKLSHAIRDGNSVRAIIRASGTNNDGGSRGIMTPNDVLQEKLICQVYSQAGITELSETAFFECHGTITPTGDPLEASAVARIWGLHGGVLMGALQVNNADYKVKPNVGHSEVPWESAKLRVPTEPEQWPVGKAERVSVISFGVSGSKAHMILESYRHAAHLESPGGRAGSEVSFQLPTSSRLLLFSAAHPDSLERQVNQYRDYIQNAKGFDIDSLAYTVDFHRDHLKHRSYAIIDGHGRLDVDTAQPSFPDQIRLNFVYTSQGVHWAGMGKEVLGTNDVFRSSIQRIDSFLQSLPDPPTWNIQVQLALTDVLFSLGIRPDAVTAHSGGEAAAAYASGAITAEQAMAVAYLRGWILIHGDVPPGAMAAVAMGPKELEPYLIPGVRDCVVNVSRDGVLPQDGSLVGCLRDLAEPTIYNLTNSTFRAFMDSVFKFQGSLVWVTPGAHASNCQDPRTAMAHGLLRTVHMEQNMDATVVEVDMTSSNETDICNGLWKISQSVHTRRKTADFDPDADYAIVNGIVQVPRMLWFGLHDDGLTTPPGVRERDGEVMSLFRAEATYLLAGGTGGIGQSVAVWMAENGARNFVFLSRSAGEPQHEAFRKAIREAPSPIADVMQLSLVLCDNAAAQMTFDEWLTAVKPRVHGTWNLHEAVLKTRAELDFLVIFGSGGGITGYHGQANYSAANTYLDAFVSYRKGLGLPASILDIGVVGDVGYLVKKEKLYAAFRNGGYLFITEQEVLDATAVAVARSRDPQTPCSCFCLGALSEVSFNDAANRLNWKRDIRCAVSHHFHRDANTKRGGGGQTADGGDSSGGSSEIERLILIARHEPDKIESSGAQEQLASLLSRQLSTLLLRPVEEFPVNSELASIGLDSIVSIELVDWVQQQFQLGMSSIEVTQCSSLMHLAGVILGRLVQGQ